jgi:beta-glucosidase-like glycosyl hydrolase
MEALARTYTPAESAVEAIAAGCDGVLVCRNSPALQAHPENRSLDVEVQVEVLEALVHAVEDGRIPYGRVEDALKRQRLAKERFLAGAGQGLSGTRGRRDVPLQSVLGCDQHRRIADEMTRFL